MGFLNFLRKKDFTSCYRCGCLIEKEKARCSLLVDSAPDAILLLGEEYRIHLCRKCYDDELDEIKIDQYNQGVSDACFDGMDPDELDEWSDVMIQGVAASPAFGAEKTYRCDVEKNKDDQILPCETVDEGKIRDAFSCIINSDGHLVTKAKVKKIIDNLFSFSEDNNATEKCGKPDTSTATTATINAEDLFANIAVEVIEENKQLKLKLKAKEAALKACESK